MDYIYVAVSILVLFNSKKSASCDNIISVAGCNVSFTWLLPTETRELLEFNIGSSFYRPIATVSADTNCDVRDHSSMLCSINISDDGLIVVLKLLNVTLEQSGNYTLWKKTILLEQSSYTSKKLVVIGNPTIIEVRKPIFGMPFQMICKWKINDTERITVYSINSHIISNLSMNDNFSNVTCQICLNKKASILSCVTCENDGCSIYSDPYTIQIIYGPHSVSLSREERHFYLKEHDIFAIDCFANCYPNCIFYWKGRVTIESQKLNIIFEPRMVGQYACHVTNEQTNITLISDPITLHHLKEDFQRDNNWLRTVIVCVFILIVGLLIVVTIWRRTNISRTIDSGKFSQVGVQLTQTEVSQRELERHNIHLHIPSTKVTKCKRTMRLECLNKSPEGNFRPHQLENHYSIINDDPLTDDNLGMDLLIKNYSHEARINTEHIEYDYARSIDVCHVETAFTHVADETSITTSSDFVGPVEIFQDEGHELHDTDHAYLTIINDAANSMEVCHTEETDLNDLDITKISPLIS
ncbi:hypothetical protein ACJMK2_026119 [Sinanodonta woodiana]|uniref:Ig-like domain-containing protein n=1 Tax=Sinanodonta woodiana TaxID=1069815 RepID=A0ABD3XKW3_SINWO